MRAALTLLPLLLTVLATASADYTETRNLTLAAKGLESMEIEAGAGSLDIVGVPGLNQIEVEAEIVIDAGKKAARKYIHQHLDLRLEADGSRGQLEAEFDRGEGGLLAWLHDTNGRINLKVRVPDSFDLEIEDGSGDLTLRNLAASAEIEDGSGKITIEEIGGNLEVDDGSGSVRIVGVNGNVRIDDGSGSMTIRNVKGNLIVDDGSGNIDIDNIGQDLTILSSGSGGLDIANVHGRTIREAD